MVGILLPEPNGGNTLTRAQTVTKYPQPSKKKYNKTVTANRCLSWWEHTYTIAFLFLFLFFPLIDSTQMGTQQNNNDFYRKGKVSAHETHKPYSSKVAFRHKLSKAIEIFL